MKKTNFMSGAIIATLGIIACKVLGLVYVIPFYAIIGTMGRSLYSYAYSIYSMYLQKYKVSRLSDNYYQILLTI